MSAPARRRPAARAVLPEAAWQRQVVDLATRCQWRHWHDYDSIRNDPGFPDLVLIRDRSLLLVELKTQTGRLSHAQLEWMAAFSTVEAGVDEFVAPSRDVPHLKRQWADRPCVEAHVWRPSDWMEVLSRLTRVRGAVRTVGP